MYTHSTSRFWLIILFFTVIGGSAGHAQTTLSGQILAEDTRRPVPYSLITEPQHRFGTYADANGRFTAYIPANVDTLLITCVGFDQRLIPLRDSMLAQTIEIRPRPKELSEVVVRGKKPRLLVLGAIRKKAPIVWGNCSGRNIEFALYIRNLKSADGYLHRVSYLIARGGVPSAPFRVRVYENSDGEPGRDLLAESLVATARRSNSWCEVDLSSFQIPFPKEGLFVAMEWLPTDENQYKFTTSFRMPDGQRNVRDCFGQYLAFSKELRSALYWERINGGVWRRHSTLSRVGTGEHPVIQAKIALTE